MKVGDLVEDRYHRRCDVIVKIWGSKKTGMFLKLANGDKIAYEYARLVNEGR
tara:strand:- start:195 stop:350 length:156 start_codon:yes stop_codon:yes gene_type:complete